MKKVYKGNEYRYEVIYEHKGLRNQRFYRFKITAYLVETYYKFKNKLNRNYSN